MVGRLVITVLYKLEPLFLFFHFAGGGERAQYTVTVDRVSSVGNEQLASFLVPN